MRIHTNGDTAADAASAAIGGVTRRCRTTWASTRREQQIDRLGIRHLQHERRWQCRPDRDGSQGRVVVGERRDEAREKDRGDRARDHVDGDGGDLERQSERVYQRARRQRKRGKERPRVGEHRAVAAQRQRERVAVGHDRGVVDGVPSDERVMPEAEGRARPHRRAEEVVRRDDQQVETDEARERVDADGGQPCSASERRHARRS
jgi:hypothetical protein